MLACALLLLAKPPAKVAHSAAATRGSISFVRGACRCASRATHSGEGEVGRRNDDAQLSNPRQREG